jgi:hypothetical protein
MIKLMVLSSLLLGALAQPALAQPGTPPPTSQTPPPNYPPSPPPGYQTYQPATYPAVAVVPARAGSRTHDGFYLNAALGPAYANMFTEVAGQELSMSGGGAALSLALGGAVAPNLILFGQLVAHAAADPKLEASGFASETLNGSAAVTGVGAGVAFYVMPVNVFLSGSALATQITISDKDNDEVGETDLGFGLNLAAGKEWWVSDNWGLGGALQFMVASMESKNAVLGSKPKWTAVSLGFVLSATFN